MSTFTILYNVLLDAVFVRGKSPSELLVLCLSTKMNVGEFLVENQGISCSVWNLWNYSRALLFYPLNYAKINYKIDLISAKIITYTHEKLYNATGCLVPIALMKCQ